MNTTRQIAGPDVVLTVIGHLLRVVKIPGDGGHPPGVTGNDAIPANVTGLAVDVKLSFQSLHGNHLSLIFAFYAAYGDGAEKR